MAKLPLSSSQVSYPDQTRNSQADSFSVGHNAAEFFFRFGPEVIVMPPAAAKALLASLRACMSEEPGGSDRRTKSAEFMPKRLLRNLYRSRKVTPSLLRVNTGRRKRRSDKE